MRAAANTNIPVCAEGLDDLARQARAILELAQIQDSHLLVPVQAPGETLHALSRKRPRELHARAAIAVRAATDENALKGQIVDTPASVPSSVLELSVVQQLSTIDAMVKAAAGEVDLFRPGFRGRGVTAVNQFAESMSSPLDTVLDQSRG